MIQKMTQKRMTVKNNLIICLVCACLSASCAWGQTIAEKKAGVYRGGDLSPDMQRYLGEVNKEMQETQARLRELYAQVRILFERNAPESDYRDLHDQIRVLSDRIYALQTSWREIAAQGTRNESYALWHSPETTLEQLILDYGSQNFVYMIPPDIAGIKLSVDSNLPIPRASWDEMLELILVQNGVGIQQLNPFLRSLFFLKDNKSDIKLITNKRRDLNAFPPNARVSYVLSPEPIDVRRIWRFLEKFANPNSIVLQMVGRDILIIGQVGEVQELLKLHDFAAVNKGDKDYKIIPLFRVDAEEMAQILGAVFEQIEEPQMEIAEAASSEDRPVGIGSRRSNNPGGSRQGGGGPMVVGTGGDSNGLKVIALVNVARAIFLVGTKEEIRQAEEIVRQVESQVGDARQRVVYWYNVKHANPEELADVLFRIYLLMLQVPIPPGALPFPGGGPGLFNADDGNDDTQINQPVRQNVVIQRGPNPLLPSELYQKDFYQQGGYVVNPAPVEPMIPLPIEANVGRDNFIVDLKTGAIVMVVEADILVKLKDVIRKLDVPVKMVQVEVLLFEIRNRKQTNFGLNLLRIGSCATNTHATCATFNDLDDSLLNNGIFNFLISRKKSSIPAYDLAYQFLMNQTDVQINANPSVVTMNQTPARIAIVEEISLDTGIFNVETAKGVTLERAFTRAQYGININITPTIHAPGDDEICFDDEPNYVTLETSITFDSPDPSLVADRPNVTRRNITNQVRIPDGQTVIMGGLRRKNTSDLKEAIPFIGELPGIGKLFSNTKLDDSTTEMFIFLTPKIISDPVSDFEMIRGEELKRRPGDIPEFLCCLVAARDYERHRLMEQSMYMLFGREPDRCHSPAYWAEYDWGPCYGY